MATTQFEHIYEFSPVSIPKSWLLHMPHSCMLLLARIAPHSGQVTTFPALSLPAHCPPLVWLLTAHSDEKCVHESHKKILGMQYNNGVARENMFALWAGRDGPHWDKFE